MEGSEDGGSTGSSFSSLSDLVPTDQLAGGGAYRTGGNNVGGSGDTTPGPVPPLRSHHPIMDLSGILKPQVGRLCATSLGPFSSSLCPSLHLSLFSPLPIPPSPSQTELQFPCSELGVSGSKSSNNSAAGGSEGAQGDSAAGGSTGGDQASRRLPRRTLSGRWVKPR